MNNFELLDIKIYNVSNEHNLLCVDLYLNVRMFDYVIDIDTNECINGSNSDKIDYDKFFSTDDKVLCFDDLERANVDVIDILGYINNFVEHDHIKTIII